MTSVQMYCINNATMYITYVITRIRVDMNVTQFTKFSYCISQLMGRIFISVKLGDFHPLRYIPLLY